MTTNEQAPKSKAPDPAQESRELLVWGALPAVVGGVGLIADAVYLGSRVFAAAPMLIGGVITLALLAISRFGRKQVSAGGSIGLLVFGIVVLAYLIYTFLSPSPASIYSLVMVLLAICVFVAGVSGLMARRVIVIR